MILSDVSVRRPVFAAVMSLLLVILGGAAWLGLPVRELPDVDPPVVSIETRYRGASAAVIETKITQLIEDRVAGLEGVRKLTSRSRDERSSIRIEFTLDRDVDAAANDVRDRVARVVNDLPEEADGDSTNHRVCPWDVVFRIECRIERCMREVPYEQARAWLLRQFDAEQRYWIDKIRSSKTVTIGQVLQQSLIERESV